MVGQKRLMLSGPRDASWWTGEAPESGTSVASLPQVATTASRADVRAYFNNSWTLTEVLFSALQSEEAFCRPPAHGLRHPLIFYYAHPAVLYVNKLRLAGLMAAPVNPEFEALFETGVDEMGWDDLSKNEMTWPAIERVHEYRATAYKRVLDIIETHPDIGNAAVKVDQQHPLWALFMGFEHERIHLETSAVLMRELPVTLLRRPEAWPKDAPHGAAPAAAPVTNLPPTTVQLGKDRAHPSFGWDNEYGERKVALGEPVVVRNRLISNDEYLTFVKDGGYSGEQFWSGKGWKWRSFRNGRWPYFWVPNGPQGLHQYGLRTTFEVTEWRGDWPVIVNFHEAEAYARWLTAREKPVGCLYRLPSEAEHHAMRRVAPRPGMNRNLQFGSESSVQGDKGEGIQDVFGNVWQWCADHFNPLPGFKVHRLYDDFSTPCFDAEHHLIMGGSFVSTGDEASRHARFHFRPHFLQNAGIRLVKSPVGYTGNAVDLRAGRGGNPYETDQLLRDYLCLHFGSPEDQMPYALGPSAATQFPQRCAKLLIDAAKSNGVRLGRVLDVGCAVGGSTFDLAAACSDKAIGVDLSDRFIQTANELKDKGSLRYKLAEEGELSSWRDAKVVSREARERAVFRRADACSLPPEFVDFDAVLIANLLCRVPSPLSVLNRMGGARGIVRKGGILVMTTPFSWLPEYTPQEVWLGGYERDGKAVWSDEELERVLAPEFMLLKKEPFPLVIREHKRKFQFIVADSYVFQRRT